MKLHIEIIDRKTKESKTDLGTYNATSGTYADKEGYLLRINMTPDPKRPLGIGVESIHLGKNMPSRVIDVGEEGTGEEPISPTRCVRIRKVD